MCAQHAGILSPIVTAIVDHACVCVCVCMFETCIFSVESYIILFQSLYGWLNRYIPPIQKDALSLSSTFYLSSSYPSLSLPLSVSPLLMDGSKALWV